MRPAPRECGSRVAAAHAPTSTMSAVPPRPRDGAPSQRASNTSQRSTMASPACCTPIPAVRRCRVRRGRVPSLPRGGPRPTTRRTRSRIVRSRSRAGTRRRRVAARRSAGRRGSARGGLRSDPLPRRAMTRSRRLPRRTACRRSATAAMHSRRGSFRIGEMTMTGDTDADHRGRWLREHGRCGQGADASESAPPPMRPRRRPGASPRSNVRRWRFRAFSS